MEIAKSNIVRSDAGRDKGKLFVVLAVEGEYLLLADGKCYDTPQKGMNIIRTQYSDGSATVEKRWVR